MSEGEAKISPNKQIDAAIKKLLKDCEGAITPEQESQIKVKAEVLKVAMNWEKVKHNIIEKDGEGSEWGAGDGQ